MLKIWAWPLRRQLVVAILWFFSLMLATVAALGFDEFRGAVEALSDQTEAASTRTASAIERELTGVDRMAGNLSMNRATGPGCWRR